MGDARFLAKNAGKLSTIVAGKLSTDYLYDNVLYPVVITAATLYFGVAWGLALAYLLMTTGSALASYLELRGYDWIAFDIKEYLSKVPIIGSILTGALDRKGRYLTFIVLCCWSDPFVTTAVLRRGQPGSGLSDPHDMKLFWASVIVSNIYWTTRWTVIVEMVIYVYTNYIHPWL